METTWIEVAGVTIRAPVSAGTNLVLAVLCLLFFLRHHRGSSIRERRWAGFFALMSMATLAGVLKHGAKHMLTEAAFASTLAVSNVASALAVYFAQEATVRSRAGASWQGPLRILIAAQLAAFSAANLAFGPELTFVLVHTAVGLAPVIVVEASGSDALPGGSLVAAGLSVSLLTGVVYLTRISLGPWMNHIDIAHVLMGVSFVLISRGVGAGGWRSWN